MAINSDTDIHLALLQLGKNANRYRLTQNSTPHEIIEWDSGNKDSQPTDDELNAAYIQWKNTEEYKETRVIGTATTSGYPLFEVQGYPAVTKASNGMGFAMVNGSSYETIVEIFKEA